MNYPEKVQGRVSAETMQLVEKIAADFGPNESTTVRMALEDYCPRYIAAKGKPKMTEFLTALAPVLEAHPELQAEVEKTVKAWKRANRIAA